MALINSIGGGVRKKSAVVALVLFCVCGLSVVRAAVDTEYEFDIPATDADIAIKALSRYTGNPVIFQSIDVTDIQINSLKGRYTLQGALDILFEGTPLSASLTTSGVITVSHVVSSNIEEEKMNTQTKGIFATIVGLLVSAGTSQSAIAQEEGTSLVLEEVVVTARRREESLIDVPVAITAFTESSIQAVGIKELGDVLNNTVGMVYNERDGNRAQAQPGVRGIKPNGVSTFIDSMPVAGSQNTIQFVDVAGVEVYRGPQSATFGRSVYAGALNYTLREPSLDEFEGGVNAKLGQFGRSELSGYLSTPIVQDKLGVYVSASTDSYDGPGGLVSTDGFKMGNRDTEYYSAALKYQPTDALSMTLRYTNLTIDDGPAPDYNFDPANDSNIRLSPTPGRAPMYFGELNFIEDPVLRRNFCFHEGLADQDCIRDPGWELERERLAFSVDYEMENGHSLAFRAFDSNDVVFDHDDQDNTDLEIGFMAVVNMGTDTKIDEEYFEVLWTSPSDQSLRYTLGYSNYSYFRENVAHFIHPSATIDGVGSAPSIGTQQIDNQGVFGGVFWDVNDSVTVSLEGRYQKDDIAANDPDPTDANDPVSNTETFLPRVAINWAFNDNVNFYAQYAEGVQPATVNSGAVAPQQRAIAAAFEGLVVNGVTYTDQTSFLDSVLAVDEQTLKNYEIGMKGRFMDDRLSFNASIFSMETDGFAQVGNLFFFPEGSDSASVLTALQARGAATSNGLLLNLSDTSVRVRGSVNVGTLESKGVELEAAYLLNENWQVDARATFLDTKYGAGCFPIGADFGLPTQDLVLASGGTINCTDGSGNDYPFTPDTQLGGAITFSDDLSNGWDWFARVDARYQSRQFLSPFNRAWLPSSTIFNLRAGVNAGNFRIEAYVENLADNAVPLGAQYEPDRKEVAAFTGNRGPTNNTGLNVAVAYPREAGVRIAYRF